MLSKSKLNLLCELLSVFVMFHHQNYAIVFDVNLNIFCHGKPICFTEPGTVKFIRLLIPPLLHALPLQRLKRKRIILPILDL